MSHTTIHLVRHGLVHNPNEVFYGRLPRYRLGAEGELQAQAAALALKDKPLVAVYSSPLLRTRQTAERILAFHPKLKVRLSRLLIEVGTPHDGSTIANMVANGWDLYSGNQHPHEQPEHITQRARKFFALMRQRHAGREVVAVSHGDVIAFSILWGSGQPANWRLKGDLRRFGITDGYPQTASITSFTFTNDKGQIDGDQLPDVSYQKPY